MRTYPLSELHRNKGDIVDAALREPIGLTKHGKRRLVLLSAEQYDALTAKPGDPRIARSLDDIPPDEAALLAAALEAELRRLDAGHDD